MQALATPPLEVLSAMLELCAGAVLTGRVISAAGASASGIKLLMTRGDGHLERVLTGPDGEYRMERLAPGAWQVRALGADQMGEVSSFRSRPLWNSNAVCEPNVTLTEGATVIHNIDLRLETAVK